LTRYELGLPGEDGHQDDRIEPEERGRMPRLIGAFYRGGRRAVAALSIVSAAVGLLVVPRGSWERAVSWVYPTPLLVLLAAALALAIGQVARLRRTPRISQRDQDQLDRVLRVLPRQALRALNHTSFIGAWSHSTTWPFYVYQRDHGEVEDRFDDPRLEAIRAELYGACAAFAQAVGHEGVPDARGPEDQFTVWIVEMRSRDPDRAYALAQESAGTLEAAAKVVEDAHACLITTAQRCRYDLSTLGGEPPRLPWRHPN
jgi:hypothetical protein